MNNTTNKPDLLLKYPEDSIESPIRDKAHRIRDYKIHLRLCGVRLDPRLVAMIRSRRKLVPAFVVFHQLQNVAPTLIAMLKEDAGMEEWRGQGWDGHNFALCGWVTIEALNLILSYASPNYNVEYVHLWLVDPKDNPPEAATEETISEFARSLKHLESCFKLETTAGLD